MSTTRDKTKNTSESDSNTDYDSDVDNMELEDLEELFKEAARLKAKSIAQRAEIDRIVGRTGTKKPETAQTDEQVENNSARKLTK